MQLQLEIFNDPTNLQLLELVSQYAIDPKIFCVDKESLATEGLNANLVQQLLLTFKHYNSYQCPVCVLFNK